MSREELLHLIALTMIPQVGPVSANFLIEQRNSAKAVFETSREELLELGVLGRAMAMALPCPEILERAEKELSYTEKHGIRILSRFDDAYPGLLKECNDPPLLLYTLGKLDFGQEPCISIVGTRRATSYGRDICRTLVRDLAASIPGLVVVSGLAYGIDVIAHRAALEVGVPTVGVLAHGLHTLYPNSHRDTARRMLEKGALVSDFDSGMGPERNNFLRRNRIIAGFSTATLVVESSLRGGALVTAQQAIGYHRDVLAVPGRAGDSRSLGCNNLIRRNMAGLVCTAENIIHALGWEKFSEGQMAEAGTSRDRRSVTESLDPLEAELYNLIRRHDGAVPETLCALSGRPIHEILGGLMDLELKGLIGIQPGNSYVCLAAN